MCKRCSVLPRVMGLIMLTLLTVAGCQPAGGTDAPADTDANMSAVQNASPHETLPTASQPDEESQQPAAKTAGGALPDLEVITLGAGDGYKVGDALLMRLAQPSGAV